MAKSKKIISKKIQKKIVKTAKKNPKIFIAAVLVGILVIGVGVGAYYFLNKKDPIESGEIQINFLELGNKYSGDSIFIQAGGKDILIDGGSRKNSAPYITNYIDSKIQDNTIEYLIVTHAHQDHIAALVGSNGQGIFDHYKVENIIQFSLTNQDETKSLYKEYLEKRDAEVASGANLFYANDLIENHNNVFDFGNNLSMTILDQKFYREIDKNDENNYSVCTLFTQGNNNYLFTGDLEKEGEESLVELNSLPKCELYKAGHHCSYTASNDVLLSKIRPENVVVTAVAGSDEYTKVIDNQFPAKASLERIFAYTDNVYVTSQILNDEVSPMNGTITLKCEDGGDYIISESNNNTKLKDTDWYRNNRKN